MKTVVKNKRKSVEAYRLGDSSPELEKLMEAGLIRALDNNTFEIMSHEALHAGSGHGELAKMGDYIKIDGDGEPYPNEKGWFEENHEHISGNQYLQKAAPLCAWDSSEPMCDEIRFLTETGRMKINESDPVHYYSAELWGTIETAPEDSVIIFYSVTRDDSGRISDVDFNFVKRNIFNDTYSLLQGQN